MEFKRRVPRRHLIYYLRVFDRGTDTLVGNLVDISPMGIMLVSDKPLDVGREYCLRMMLPELVEGSRYIDFNGRAVWTKNDINPDFYDTGFELVDPSQEFLAVLEGLLEELAFKE